MAQTEDEVDLRIYQVKISKGHATLVVVKDIRAGNNTVYSSTLIDAGNTVADGQAIAAVIRTAAGGRLDRVYITHSDGDHYKGLLNEGAQRGILNLRCLNNSIGDPLSMVNGNPNPLQLYQCLVPNQTFLWGAAMLPNTTDGTLATYGGDNLLQVRDWQTGDLDIGPASLPNTIMFRTLAINRSIIGRDERIATSNILDSGPSKNDRSAVVLVTWDNFSFLIQGDMEAQPGDAGEARYAAAQSKIARTTEHFLPDATDPNDYRRISDIWEDIESLDPLPVPELEDTRPGEEGVVRHSHALSSIARGRLQRGNNNLMDIRRSIQTRLHAYPNMIAWPDLSRHILGGVFNNHLEEPNGYAHVCIALVPHHGALTANLWFDTVHGIIGSNSTNEFGHPNADAIEAMYNTSGIRQFYFTYLQNRTGLGQRQLAYANNRRTQKFDGGADFSTSTAGTNYHSLNDTWDLFRFTVRTGTGVNADKKVFRGVRRTLPTLGNPATEEEVRQRLPCERGH